VTHNGITNVEQVRAKSEMAKVLIVENDPSAIRQLLEVLAKKAITGIVANGRDAVVDFIQKIDFDLVFTSDRITAGPGRVSCGFDMLKEIKKNTPEMPVVMITDDVKQKDSCRKQTVPTAVRAIRAGCCDFLVKPLDPDTIENILETYLPNHNVSTLEEAFEDSHNLFTIIGKSAEMYTTIELAKRVAPTNVPVLVSGESGTGKELISYLIHRNSKRANGPYVKINCAALSDSLLESELFGHEKGAFTGAIAQRKGRFEMAHGGTLLLDEITETPLKFQAKLLRILEQQDFERVGGNENISVNVRIISTTNRNLLQEVQLGRFREDLYYRLSGVRLVLSPLRERSEDLEDLVWHFINCYVRQTQRQIKKLDPAMMNILAKYQWPGNIRQLRNVVLTSLILGTGKTLSLADVSWLFDELQPLPQNNDFTLTESVFNEQQPTKSQDLGGIPLAKIERRAILDTLKKTDGNQTRAADILGISDRTLRDKIKRYRSEGVLQLT
jgi:DNA-binding NtrC family response regulator